MGTFFLVIIYLAFISLGLPDSLLGVAWPVMHLEINAPLEAAGLISMIVAGGTIISSLASGTILKYLGTGKVTFISCLMTASALLGFSFAPSLAWFALLAIPLGLGAGSVDAGLNNYVATHYKARHMSWLHCFWGVGATVGPMIMSGFILKENYWRGGYLTVASIQFMLVILLFLTLPLWDKAIKQTNGNFDNSAVNENTQNSLLENKEVKVVKPMQIKGVKIALISFLFYCGTELTLGLWGSSYLVNIKGLPAATAAQWVAMYYGGITIGRFLTGFLTIKISNPILIRLGQIMAFIGTIFLLLPLPNSFSLIGFILIGLGCAPIYPCMLHETPKRFGKENSQMLMGYQMAFAYIGSTFLPPFLGWLAARLTIGILPIFLLIYILVMLIGAEILNIYQKNILFQK